MFLYLENTLVNSVSFIGYIETSYFFDFTLLPPSTQADIRYVNTFIDEVTINRFLTRCSSSSAAYSFYWIYVLLSRYEFIDWWIYHSSAKNWAFQLGELGHHEVITLAVRVWTLRGSCLLVDGYYIAGKQLVRSVNTKSSLTLKFVGWLYEVHIPLLRLSLTYLIYLL